MGGRQKNNEVGRGEQPARAGLPAYLPHHFPIASRLSAPSGSPFPICRALPPIDNNNLPSPPARALFLPRGELPNDPRVKMDCG